MKISYSAWQKYMTCPKLYDYHYNHRLRPAKTGSALAFGIAMDVALNALLETGEDPLPVFRENFKFEDLQDVEWDPRDLDLELFDTDQMNRLGSSTFEHKAWASMRIKGRLLLESYLTEIYPQIEEVIHVQKNIEGRPGVLDAVVKLRGYGTVLLDHKTATRPYGPDAVRDSTQLALYAAAEGFKKAGFVVLVKTINKNRVKICKKCSFNGSFTRHKTCPRTVNGSRCHGSWEEEISPNGSIQLLIDDIPELNKELITTSINETQRGIAEGIYPMNLTACGKMYGKPCPYIEKCWKNKETGLIYKKESK